MPMPQIKITKKKDGREVAWFRDPQGRVRTRVGADWVRADQLRELAEYGIQLQRAQCAAGLGSDGTAMPALQGESGKVVFIGRENGKAKFGRGLGYAGYKTKLGLAPIRDLWGPGIDGHMLDDIRITYLDDKQCVISISRQSSRNKARGNERRAPWWGWNPESVRLLTAKAAEIFQTGTAEYLVAMGLISANQIANRRLVRRVA